MSPMRCRLWPLWLLMTCGAGAGARTSSDDAPSSDDVPASDDVLTDQLSCMADYLRVKHRHRVDIFVDVPITKRQLSGLLLLLSGRQLFARLWRGSPAFALQQEEEASSELSDQAVWLVPDTDSDATDALLARVRADGRRRWLLASLSGRRRGQFLGGFAQRHTYMTFRNGTTRFHRARDFHQRRRPVKGVCRGGEYKERRRQRAGAALSRRAMEGVHLRVLYADADKNPGVQALQMLHRDGVITGGFVGSLILVLQEVLGFSYSVHEVNGTEDLSPWDHVVQLLHQGHGDLFGGRMIISSSRKQLVDFSFPLFYEIAGAVIDSRYMLTLTEFQITQPLQRSVWCALLLTQLLAVLVLCLIARCQQQIRRACTGEPCDALDVSLWALVVLGVSCQQGAAVRSDAAASYRLAIAALYLMSLFIAACYSGNLLAEMTLARRVMPFNSLQQALGQGWQVTDAGLSLAVRETILQPLMGRDISQLPMVSEGPLEGRVIQMSDVLFATTAATWAKAMSAQSVSGQAQWLVYRCPWHFDAASRT